MRTSLILAAMLTASNCLYSPPSTPEVYAYPVCTNEAVASTLDPWQEFLRHLPEKQGKIVAYNGALIRDQDKHTAIIPYDVGERDLQQCADALIRLRAEYLFKQQQYDKISFQFTSGHYYSWEDYCKGLQPRIRGNDVRFVPSSPRSKTYASLRSYLDIVYTYAGTQSLYRQLKPVKDLRIGTVIIKPGSPGHCCIVIDETTRHDGTKVYKLVEGFMPAQSIYILKNPVDGSPWHELKAGVSFRTASYHFTTYALRQF
jgi:hypothetical protein